MGYQSAIVRINSYTTTFTFSNSWNHLVPIRTFITMWKVISSMHIILSIIAEYGKKVTKSDANLCLYNLQKPWDCASYFGSKTNFFIVNVFLAWWLLQTRDNCNLKITSSKTWWREIIQIDIHIKRWTQQNVHYSEVWFKLGNSVVIWQRLVKRFMIASRSVIIFLNDF